MFPQNTLNRLHHQLDSLDLVLRDASVPELTTRSRPDQWSAQENIAHLARHHDLFLDRVSRILTYDRPKLGRYSAEKDPKWSAWSGLAADELLLRLRALRQQLTEKLCGLSDAELERTGTHALLGEMNIIGWLEFFLLHEAHHLYVIMLRLGEARRDLALKKPE